LPSDPTRGRSSSTARVPGRLLLDAQDDESRPQWNRRNRYRYAGNATPGRLEKSWPSVKPSTSTRCRTDAGVRCNGRPRFFGRTVHVWRHCTHCRRRGPKRRTRAPQQGDFACLEFMHANYPKYRPAVSRKIRLPHAQYQQNFFTHPQFATSSLGPRQASWGGQRYLPFAFTEHGAIMAATILNTPRATEVSVFVVRAFVRLREMVAANKELAKSPQHNETHAALSRFWLHGQDDPVSVARIEIVERRALSQNCASPQGVAARIDTGFVARLANIHILAAPRFAPLPILTRTARAFHHVAGSRNLTNWNAASRITTRRSPASSKRSENSPHRRNRNPSVASVSFPMTDGTEALVTTDGPQTG
jgi:hypothetical protein